MEEVLPYLEALATKAAAALRQHLGEEVSLREPRLLRDKTRSLVVRCQVQSSQTDLSSVVIKYFRDDVNLGFSDWASLAFLAEVGETQGLVPRFLGGDVTNRLFVMEDLGDSQSLENVLSTSGNAETARANLRSLATTMARLQGVTTGSTEQRFEAVRRTLPQTGERGRRYEAESWLGKQEQITGWVHALGSALPTGFAECLESIAGIYAEPGTFLRFTHGDPAPSNNHVAADGAVRLLDFEYGGFRHALYDITGWSVLCPLPSIYIQDMSRTFQQEFAIWCPEAGDDATYAEAWGALCAFRALAILTWIGPDILEKNRPWADADWTCRHAVLAAVSRLREATEAVAPLGPVNDFALQLTNALHERWPELGRPEELTPQWPAFTP